MSSEQPSQPPADHEKYRALYTLGSTMTFNTLIEADHLSNLALSMLVEFTGAGRGHLILFDEEGQVRHRFGLQSGEEPEPSQLEPSEERDLLKIRNETGAQTGREGRALSIPLKAEEAAVGALQLIRGADSPAFTAGDRALLEACATHLAQSLRSRRLYESHLAQKRRADLVDEVTRAVHGPGDLEETLGTVIRSAAEALEATSGAVLLGDAAGRLGVAAGHRMPEKMVDMESRPAEGRMVRWVFTEGTPFCDGQRILTPISQILRDRRVFDERRRSIHGTPFSRTLGLLYLEGASTKRPFSEEDLITLRVFADHAAVAITSNALIQQASLDPLTQLDSRFQLEPRLGEELKFARQHGVPVSLIMVDVDHFKKINDLHGHQEGDEVLRQLARILRDAIRQNDICARYGGEEFTVVLPETPLAGAQIVAENIRRRVEGSLFSRERIPVTVSIGVAEFPLHANTAEGLLRRADQALYEAKAAGRNRARTARSL
jgi:diguanylate cyclase (GGDEF)-like protein